MRARLAVVTCCLILSACDRRPIDAAAALPAPGTRVPTFSYPAVSGDSPVSSEGLRGAPAVIALWSTHCPFQGPAMAAFDSLAQEFRADGVQFVLLADDASGPVLDSILNAAAWRTSVDYLGVAAGSLVRRFDHSASVSRDYPYRVEFVLPSFLLVDGNGTIVRRAFGAAADVLRPALDSLVRSAARPPAAT